MRTPSTRSARNLAAPTFLLAACLACASINREVDAPAPLPGASIASNTGKPNWIWASGSASDGQRAFFRRTFSIDGDVDTAWLWASGDDHLRVWVNGEFAVRHDGWTPPVYCAVEGLLHEGANTIAVLATNDGGPAGLCIELEFTGTDGSTRLISDGDWRALPDSPVDGWRAPLFDDTSWPAADVLAKLGDAPWGELPPPVPPQSGAGEFDEAPRAETLQAPPGFRVERLVSVPRDEQGSWVSLAFDDRGRIYTSDQYGGLFRVTPPPIHTGHRGEQDDLNRTSLVEPVPAPIGEAQGMTFAFGALYVVVNSSGTYESGLYRVSDLDGDDALEHVEQLAHFEGSGEHGPHAVRLGPDGKSLWVIAGNHTQLPENLISSRVPLVWGEDQLLPRIDDPRGHAAGVMAPGGWICRTDRAGHEYELYAIGMRNAYDFDFSPKGKALTFDSDMEWDVGLPWYRPARILELASGADFGWRHGSGKWPASYPDSSPALLDIGLASPTGVVFGTQTRFPEPWRSALFVADWSYGKVIAVHTDDAAHSETFLQGHPLPVTDLAVGPDGALYLTTGGRRTQSGLYRISWTGADTFFATEQQPKPEPRQLMELLHGRSSPGAVDEIWPHLRSPRRDVRYAARIALEIQPVESWRSRALSETDPTTSIEALMALVRSKGEVPEHDLAERMIAWPLEDMDGPQRIAALRVMGLGFIRNRLSDDLHEIFAARLRRVPALGGDDADRELARLSAFLGDASIIPATIDRLLRSDAPDALDDLHILGQVNSGWETADVQRLSAWLRAEHDFEGGASLGQYVEHLREDVIRAMGLDPADFAEEIEQEVDTQLAVNTVPREITPWSQTSLTTALAGLTSNADLERGRDLFERTRCLECHRIEGKGGSTGPDLNGAGARFSLHDLLVTLLDPSVEISDQYQDTEIVTVDDELVVGRIVGEDPMYLRLRLVADDALHEIERADIVTRRPHPLSRMPSGLIDGLTAEEVRDLSAFVLGGH